MTEPLDNQRDHERVHKLAGKLLNEAAHLGIVVTISQRPTEPLAMGSYSTVVETRDSAALRKLKAPMPKGGQP